MNQKSEIPVCYQLPLIGYSCFREPIQSVKGRNFSMRKTYFEVSENGIIYQTQMRTRTIPWEEVDEVVTIRRRGIPYFGIRTKKKHFRPHTKIGTFWQALTGAGLGLWMPLASFPDFDPVRLSLTIRRAALQYGEKRNA